MTALCFLFVAWSLRPCRTRPRRGRSMRTLITLAVFSLFLYSFEAIFWCPDQRRVLAEDCAPSQHRTANGILAITNFTICVGTVVSKKRSFAFSTVVLAAGY